MERFKNCFCLFVGLMFLLVGVSYDAEGKVETLYKSPDGRTATLKLAITTAADGSFIHTTTGKISPKNMTKIQGMCLVRLAWEVGATPPLSGAWDIVLTDLISSTSFTLAGTTNLTTAAMIAMPSTAASVVSSVVPVSSQWYIDITDNTTGNATCTVILYLTSFN